MIIPLQITFRNIKPSEQVQEWIREEAVKLDEFYNRITACRVAVELLNRRHKGRNTCHVRIDLTVPGGELVAKRQPSLHSSIQHIDEKKGAKHLEVRVPHKELRQAISEAFNEMGRQLKEYARRQRGDMKTHESASRARVSKLFPAERYGFLETPDGREIYFHKNSLLNGDFGHLKIDSIVKFTEEEGEKGPQAIKVKLARNRQTLQNKKHLLIKSA